MCLDKYGRHWFEKSQKQIIIITEHAKRGIETGCSQIQATTRGISARKMPGPQGTSMFEYALHPVHSAASCRCSAQTIAPISVSIRLGLQ